MLSLIIAAVVIAVVVIVALNVKSNTQNTSTNTSGGGGTASGGAVSATSRPASTGTGAKGVEKKKVEASIMSIGIVDENNKIITSRTSKQYVNIRKDAKYIDTGNNIKHTGILSQILKFKVTFNHPGNHKFYVKLVPEAGNIAYTDTEKDRHANFKNYLDNINNDQTKGVEFTTDSNGEKIIDGNDKLILSPAGGDIFTLVATDEENNEVKSRKIQTERMMYYVEAKMPVV